LDEPGLTAKRASKILYSRGVAGLLISPLQKARGHLSLEWDKFSCVAFGYSMIRPKLNLVTAHHYRAIITSVRRLRALGHRRIGFAWHRLMNERMDRLWSSAFAGELESLPESRSIPIFWMRENTKGDFLNWCKHHRPEAIITSSPNVLHWLNEAGYPVPEEVSVVIPFLQESETKFDGKIDHSGVVEPSRQIGRSAAELLMGMIARKECGIPPHPHRLLIEGWWHEGETTKRRRGRRGIGS
jgi:DNA-binding LacI/PurR family transcriptional regulator